MSVFGIFSGYDFVLDFFMTNTVTFSNTFLLLFLEMGEVDDSGLLSVWLLNWSLDVTEKIKICLVDCTKYLIVNIYNIYHLYLFILKYDV